MSCFFAGDKHKVAEVVVVEEEAEAVLVVAEVISVGEAEAEVHQEVVAVDVVVALGEEGGDKTTFCNVSSALPLLSLISRCNGQTTINIWILT